MILFFLISCDDPFDPLDEQTGLYSVYGYLDMDADVNYLRIKDLNVPLLDWDSTGVNALVTLRDLETNVVEELTDTIIVFDSIITNNFKSSMQIAPEKQYELGVINNEGFGIRTIATAPNRVDEVIFNPATVTCGSNNVVTFRPVRAGYIEPELHFNAAGRDYVARFPIIKIIRENQEVLFFFNMSKTVRGVSNNRASCGQVTGKVIFKYFHYGPGFFDRIIGENVRVPDGLGIFGILYSEEFEMPFQIF